MPPKALNAGAKTYVLEEFDKGGTPGQILNAFRTTGQRHFSLATIEKCLQDNGRSIYNYNSNTASQGYKCSSNLPPVMPERTNPYAGNRAASTTNPYGERPTRNYAASASDSHGQQTAAITGAQASAQAYTNVPPVYQWNARADDFTLSAYRIGRTASQIADQLRNNGYNITVEEVAASLRKQGYTNVVW